MSDLRVGRIAYTNVVPVYAGIDAGAVHLPGRLASGTPALLNARIAAGELDISPVSAAFALRNAGSYVVLPGLCIGSRAEVMSVVLVSREPLARLDGQRVAVTSESATGRVLLEILLRRKYGVRVTYEPVANALASAAAGVPTLLIGERALDAVASVPEAWVHDLGTEWHAWTGIDMVYALWVARADIAQANPDAVTAVGEALRSSLAWSLAHPAETTAAARRIAERPAALYDRYFRTLTYALDARAQAGLERFARELAALDAASASPEVLRVAR